MLRGLGSTEGPVLDLGSGGGVPGLVLAFCFPDRTVTLLDGSDRRTAWLRQAVALCDLGERVEVVTLRAELAGHDTRYRGRFPAVVARSFSTPPVTAECAAALLAPTGVLVVSEPPSAGTDRWPAAPLAEVGLVPGALVETASGHFQVLRLDGQCPDRYPRRTGVPAKRPLYRVATPEVPAPR